MIPPRPWRVVPDDPLAKQTGTTMIRYADGTGSLVEPRIAELVVRLVNAEAEIIELATRVEEYMRGRGEIARKLGARASVLLGRLRP